MESRERIEETAATWIARRNADGWSEADDAELTAWLAAAVAHRVAYYRLNAAWQEAGRLQALRAGDRNAWAPRGEAPTPLLETGEGRGPAKWIRVGVAASVLLAITLATTYYLWPAGPSYRTELGGVEAVPLSDGSRITLNTDSEIRVAVTDTERRIDLERGEAFFEVKRDPARPFVVTAGGKRIVAVGTQFSVRNEEDGLRVLVSEGRVRIESSTSRRAEKREGPAEREGEVLHAGTIARVMDDAFLVEENRLAEVERALTWRSGQLTFRDTPLADAVAEFNRYNARKIVIEDPGVAALRVGGIFRATNVDPFVHLIEEAFPIHAEHTEDRIILSAAN